ncbi:MAG: hypothetical protein ACI8WB_002917 [Phenylobacterium sp.]
MRNRFLIIIGSLFILLSTLVSCTTPQETTIAPTLPTKVEAPLTQQDHFQFAWDTFLYLNLPAASGDGVIWESYKEAYDVFVPQPQGSVVPPSPWGAPDQLPASCSNAQTKRVIRQTSKSSGDGHYNDTLDERMQAVGGIILDQNSMLARYEVRMNETMFDYIVKHQLFNGVKQATFNQSVVWPVGTMELKAAWRQLTPAELKDKSIDQKYYVTEALLYNDPDSPDDWPMGRFGADDCKMAKVALVGLHIVYKIKNNPLFVWMSFEHIDNINPPHGGSASFNNPQCPASCSTPATGQVYQPGEQCYNCVANCRNAFQYCEAATKTQIVREVPIPSAVKTFNKTMQAQLAGSKWANYELIGMQYPQSILTYDSATGERLLGNSTMETYNQTYSSCIGCHYFARTTNPLNTSDFSWFLRRAKKPADFEPPLKDLLAHHIKTPPKERGTQSMSPGAVFNKVKDYTSWGTWPADQWNDFQQALPQTPGGPKGLPIPGENPHGNFIRIFVNKIGLDSARTGAFEPGSIIVKENLACQYSVKGAVGLGERCTANKNNRQIYQSPLEWTIMLKMPQGYYPQGGDWYYLKGRIGDVSGEHFVDVAGKVEACAACHAPKNSGNFMFTHNFGKRPAIRSRCVDPVGPGMLPGCSVK